MTQTATRQPLTEWEREDGNWVLVVDGLPYACITRECKRWLCWTTEDTASDGFVGQAPTLAAAKVHLERRAILDMQQPSVCEEAPL